VMVRARAAVAAAEELPGRAGMGSSHPSACIPYARGNRGGRWGAQVRTTRRLAGGASSPLVFPVPLGLVVT
jgi:hypothetical protein